MERFQVPGPVLDKLRKNGAFQLPSFDSADYEARRVAAMNALPGHLTDYNCDLCKNRGYRAELRDGYIVSVECPCMEIRRSIRRATSCCTRASLS